MSTEIKKEIALEIAHILFIDTVGYSKLSINEQGAAIDELNEVVRASVEFQKAKASGRLIKIPTGDGMALVFYTSPEAPAQCAIEINGALKEHPRLQLRMGVHSGPVSGVIDVNGHANLAGAGLNIAQRVMNCGDAGHILVSKHIAEDLGEYEHWRPFLHDLGECEVKHGMRVSIVNLHADEVGNPQLPKKFQALKKHRARMRWAAATAALLALAAIIAGMAMFSRYRVPSKLAAPEKSIAVLPFENLSRDPDSAYFAAGIQDEILTRLANLPELKVISRASTEKYPSRPQNLKTVAAELGVVTVLEGSVQKLANDAHVNVQLIDARNDAHIWAQSYDRTLEHVFAVEGEVAQSVADALRVKLLPAQVDKLNALPTQNAKAYDLFLKGEYALDRAWTSASYEPALEPAIAYFREAVALDPQFALAFARLAKTELTEYHFGLIDYSAIRRPEFLASAKENIDRALRLQPDLPAAHSALGYWYDYGKSDYDAAQTEFKRALDVDPRFFEASVGIAVIALRQGRPDEVIEQLSKLLDVDPRNVRLLRNLAVGYQMKRDYAHVVELSSHAVALDPTNQVDVTNLSMDIIAEKGDIRAAIEVLDAVPTELQQNQITVERRARLLTLGRDFVAAQQTVESLPPENWRSAWRRPLLLGEIHRALNQKEVARKFFEQARTLLIAAIGKDPEEPLTHAELALVDAGLGLSDDALREAGRAIDLQPVEKDAYLGPQWLENLADVNAELGRVDEAIKLLERLVSMPNAGQVASAWGLKLDPTWDALRGDPRFQKLVAEAESMEKR